MEENKEMTRCAHCGKMHPMDEMTVVSLSGNDPDDYELWCDDCVEEDAIKCDECGRYFHPDHITYVESSGANVCDRCLDRFYTECDHCGRLHNNAELGTVYTNSGRELWCDDCVDDDARECEDCQNLWAKRDLIHVDGADRDVCPDCYGDYSECECCGERFHDDDMTEIAGHGYWCIGCRDTQAVRCENCDDWVAVDDAYYDEETNENLCGSCYESRTYGLRVRRYHCGPPLMLYGKYEGAFKGLGVELEVDDGRRPDECIEELEELHEESEVYYEHDGSLGDSGFEIITQPHTEEAFLAMDWQHIMETCIRHGYRSHDTSTCGLHVHVSREMFGDSEEEQELNIAKVVAFYERNWDDMIRLSRRTEENASMWAKRYSSKNVPKLSKDRAEEIVKECKNQGHSARYYAVNLTNEATIEFRLCRGTLKLESFLAWVDLTLRLVDASRRIGWEELDDIALWLRDIKPATWGYVKERNAFEALYREAV